MARTSWKSPSSENTQLRDDKSFQEVTSVERTPTSWVTKASSSHRVLRTPNSRGRELAGNQGWSEVLTGKHSDIRNLYHHPAASLACPSWDSLRHPFQQALVLHHYLLGKFQRPYNDAVVTWVNLGDSCQWPFVPCSVLYRENNHALDMEISLGADLPLSTPQHWEIPILTLLSELIG